MADGVRLQGGGRGDRLVGARELLGGVARGTVKGDPTRRGTVIYVSSTAGVGGRWFRLEMLRAYIEVCTYILRCCNIYDSLQAPAGGGLIDAPLVLADVVCDCWTRPFSFRGMCAKTSAAAGRTFSSASPYIYTHDVLRSSRRDGDGIKKKKVAMSV